MFAVVSARLLAGGLDAGLVLLLFLAPVVLCLLCVTAVRTLVLGAVVLFPGRFLSWRAGLWLLILAATFFMQPAAELGQSLWTRTETTVVPPTDWVGGMALAWLSGDRVLALSLFGSAVLATGLCLALDFMLFRALFLRRFDRLLARLAGNGRPGPGLAGRLLDLLPAAPLGIPLRALARKEILRVLRDPVLSLALQVPVLVVALSAGMAEATVGRVFQGSAPVDLGRWTRLLVFATLGLVLVAGGVAAAALLVAWEGRRLGPLRVAPHGERALFAGKAGAAACLLFALWLSVYVGARLYHGPWAGLGPWVTWAVLPLALLAAAGGTACTGTTVGSLFARFEAKNPILGIGFLGLALQFSLAVLMLASTAFATLVPAHLGPRYLPVDPALALVWLAVLPWLCTEGVRALKRHRVE